MHPTASPTDAPILTAYGRTRRDNLAAIYQEVLTAVVRLRANPQSVNDPAGFRAQITAALASAEDTAARAGYSREDALLAKFAAVAFLDESVLNSANPALVPWTSKPLQEELFGVHVAGEMFFRNADRCLEKPDTPELADVLEVFGLCLQLGFRGRFRSGGTGELRAYVQRMMERVARIRGTQPAQAFTPTEPVRAVSDPWQRRLVWITLASSVTAIVLFVMFFIFLRSGSSEVTRMAEGIVL